MTEPAPGQIPCPDCGAPIALPIEAVLAGRPITCANCGLELQVDQSQSKEALSALGRWYAETEAARETANPAHSGGASIPIPPQRPRR